MGLDIGQQEGTLQVAGALRDHPRATAFATEVQRVHHRYAAEVVGAFSLCPFMRDPTRAFGHFCVMLDRKPDLQQALAQVVAASSQVVHLVYPLVTIDVPSFERFGNALHQAVAKAVAGAPVHASFHPRMEGDASRASRLVGLLRRAPDPFVQFVPEGLHEGGTMFMDLDGLDLSAVVAANKDRTASTFERLSDEDVEAIVATQDDIKDEREERYAPYLEALG